MTRLAAPSLSLRRYGAVQASDVHDFHQIVLGVDGAMTMTVDGVDERIDRRCAWLIPAGARHDYAGLADNSQLVLDLPPGSLAVPERLFERARTMAIDPGLTTLVGELASRIARGPLADAASARRLHWQAAARLCGALVGELDGAPSQPAVGLDFARSQPSMRAKSSPTAGCARTSRSRCASPISPRIAASACAASISFSAKRSARRRIAICSGCGSTQPSCCSGIRNVR
ncbi:AraC family transcriptional regulator [Burkholderia pseudomallei]|nr:AraC family transcriptional regulator [Burkholderia pseudomallei]